MENNPSLKQRSLHTKLIFLVILVLLSTVGCQNNSKPEPYQVELTKKDPDTDTTLISTKYRLHIITTSIGGDLVSISATAGKQPALQDTIAAAGLARPAFPDFNNDGYPDILLSYNGNNTTDFLYLFDTASGRFISIDGFINFPDAVQLQAKRAYYYSYYSEGCSDQNWVSDLFRIEASRAIKIGHMYGKGCDFNILENPQFIGIYKIDPNNSQSEELVEKLPYLSFIPTNKDKSSFLENYWNKNYHKFE